MHADIDQLLSLRDGEPVAADIRVHVQDCKRCRALLGELQERQGELHALAVLEPPAGAWAAIRARAEQRRSDGLRRQRAPFIAAGVVAALVVLVGALASFSVPHSAPVSASVRGAKPVASARELAQLIARSNRLERQLASLEQAGSGARVMRVSTAATIVDLEDHIASIDAQLDSQIIRPDSSAARALWQGRVDLMQSLLAVRASHHGAESL